MTTRVLGTLMAGVALTLAIVASPLAQAAQEKPTTPVSIAGKWQTALEMEVGTASIVLVFTQDGEKIAGTYTGRYGEYPLVGKVAGRKIEFVVTIVAEGTDTQMYFEGDITETPQGLLLKGVADLGGMGEAGWTAKRAT